MVFATASARASPASTTGAGTRRSRCPKDVMSMLSATLRCGAC